MSLRVLYNVLRLAYFIRMHSGAKLSVSHGDMDIRATGSINRFRGN